MDATDKDRMGDEENTNSTTQVLETQDENRGKSYFCDKCGVFLKDWKRFKTHKRTHRIKLKKYKCDFCEKSFASKVTRDRHHNIHTGEKMFSCDKCDRKFGHSLSLHRHQKTIHKMKSAFCSLCNKTFHTEVSFENHKRIVHCGKAENKQYPCKVCGRIFLNRKSRSSHVKKKHGAQQMFACFICHRKFDSSFKLRKHVNVHQEESTPQPFQFTFDCPQCKKVFNNKTRQQKHSSVCPMNAFHCGICKKTFSKLQWLKRHMTIYHLNSDDKSETSVAKIKSRTPKITSKEEDIHLIVQDTDYSQDAYSSSLCKTGFRDKNLLNTHMTEFHLDEPHELHSIESTVETRQQTKTTVSVCCRASTADVSEVEAPQQIHSSTRHFINLNSLQNAIRCDICEREFNETNLLVAHVRSFHMIGNKKIKSELKEEPVTVLQQTQKVGSEYRGGYNNSRESGGSQNAIRCDICEKEFHDTSSLMTHTTTFHLNVNDETEWPESTTEIHRVRQQTPNSPSKLSETNLTSGESRCSQKAFPCTICKEFEHSGHLCLNLATHHENACKQPLLKTQHRLLTLTRNTGTQNGPLRDTIQNSMLLYVLNAPPVVGESKQGDNSRPGVNSKITSETKPTSAACFNCIFCSRRFVRFNLLKIHMDICHKTTRTKYVNMHNLSQKAKHSKARREHFKENTPARSHLMTMRKRSFVSYADSLDDFDL